MPWRCWFSSFESANFPLDGRFGPDSGSSSSELAEVEKKLEPVIADLPGPKQTQIRESFMQVFMGLVERSSGPRLDPETARIVTASIDKDNENKFKYLTQKQADLAAQQARDHDLAMSRHRDGMTLLKPIIIASICLVGVSVLAGIYFIAIGQEAVGSSLLTGILAFCLGILADWERPDFYDPAANNERRVRRRLARYPPNALLLLSCLLSPVSSLCSARNATIGSTFAARRASM